MSIGISISTALGRGGGGGIAIHPRWTGASVVYWALDETSGNRAALAGGLTLTDHNTVGSVAGAIDLAAQFVGASSEYLDTPDNDLLHIGEGDFTIRAWIRTASGGGAYQYPLAKEDETGREWHLESVADSTIAFTFRLYDGASGIVGSVASATLAADTRYYVVITRVGNDLEMTIDNGTATTGTVTGTPSTGIAAPFQLGRTGAFGGAGYITGDIDELAIVKGLAWDAADVDYDFNAGAGRRFPD